MTTSVRASLLALSIAALPLSVQAAGLGQINVLSGLGQPLRAEIQISATAQELQSLSARIASAEAFRRANLSYGSAVECDPCQRGYARRAPGREAQQRPPDQRPLR